MVVYENRTVALKRNINIRHRKYVRTMSVIRNNKIGRQQNPNYEKHFFVTKYGRSETELLYFVTLSVAKII